jgi:hypothetical protein
MLLTIRLWIRAVGSGSTSVIVRVTIVARTRLGDLSPAVGARTCVEVKPEVVFDKVIQLRRGRFVEHAGKFVYFFA